MVCHVLRYTDFFQKVKAIFDSGCLGQIVHIAHSENVAYYHSIVLCAATGATLSTAPP